MLPAGDAPAFADWWGGAVQNRTAYSGGDRSAQEHPDSLLTVELASVVSAARRRATRDGDRQVDTAHLGAALGPLGAAGLRSLTSTPPTLEELFLRHYQDDLSRDGRPGRRAGARTDGAVTR